MKTTYVAFEKDKEGARIFINPHHAELVELSQKDAVILKDPPRAHLGGIPPHLWKLKGKEIYSDVRGKYHFLEEQRIKAKFDQPEALKAKSFNKERLIDILVVVIVIIESIKVIHYLLGA